MDKNKLIKLIEDFAPLETQQEWDCSGWIVEKEEQFDIKTVMLALTVTENVVKQAIEKNCDLIISHHPLFEVPVWFNRIQIYCAHTNLDLAAGGTTDTLIESLKLDVKFFETENFIRYVELKDKMSLSTLLKSVKKISPHARYINNKNKKTVKKIALCAGSGSEFIKDAEKKNFDVFITGDVKYHTAADSNIIIIDIGHFESERPVLKVLKKILNNNVEVMYAKEKTPFNNI